MPPEMPRVPQLRLQRRRTEWRGCKRARCIADHSIRRCIMSTCGVIFTLQQLCILPPTATSRPPRQRIKTATRLTSPVRDIGYAANHHLETRGSCEEVCLNVEWVPRQRSCTRVLPCHTAFSRPSSWLLECCTKVCPVNMSKAGGKDADESLSATLTKW